MEKMNIIKVKRLRPDARVPAFGRGGDAGFDLFMPEKAVINHGEGSVKIPLGIAIEIPKGFYVQINLRSSTGLKTPLRLSNQVGIIDEGYRGEICLILDNISQWQDVTIEKGSRIAQGILMKRQFTALVEVKELSKSERGNGGFGSTGK